jgi:hypothetical protein
MTNSATSTEARSGAAAPPGDSGFHPWHFFALLSMVGATAAVMLARDTHPVSLLLLSGAVIASGVVAIAFHYALAGFVGARYEPLLKESVREGLEREKALVLRSIKELEFDRAMKKVADADYAELSSRLRARAMSLMEELEQAAPNQTPETASALTPERTSTSTGACAACGTTNDSDARFCKGCGARVAAAVALIFALLLPGGVLAQQAMPDLKAMSGVPRETPEEPAGVVSVRVVRGSFNNLANQPVEFTVDGERRVLNTDDGGRARIERLRPGARVRAVTTVDGERLETQEIVMGSNGVRVLLVATDPDAAKRADEDKALAAATAVKGLVVLGPETRVIAQFQDDRLTIFYVLQIMNSARTPVEIGGPLIFDLPREARGASLLPDSSKQATVSGARVTVLGPFAPGATHVEVAYELPYDGPTARLTQRWPATLEQTTVLVLQTGTLGMSSPQIQNSREMADQGQRVLVGGGPGLAAGQSLDLEITGLPYHPRWPGLIALSLAGAIALAGIWAAATARPGARPAV